MSESKPTSRIFLGQYDGLGKQVRKVAVESIGRVASKSPFNVDGWLVKPLRGLLTKNRSECPLSGEEIGGKYPTSRCGLTYAVGLREGIEQDPSETIIVSACGVAGEQCLRLCESLTAEVSTAVQVSGTKLSS